MLDQLCQVITVDRDALPVGHDFVIVVQEAVDDVFVFAAADDRAQLEARVAFLEWDRLRDAESVTRAPRPHN